MSTTSQSQTFAVPSILEHAIDRMQPERRARRAAEAYASQTGFDVSVVDLQTGVLESGKLCDLVSVIPESLLDGIRPITEPRVFSLRTAMTAFLLPVPGEIQGRYAVIGWCNSTDPHEAADLCRAALEAGWSVEEWKDWEQRHTPVPRGVLERLLSLSSHGLRQSESLRRATEEADALAEQINALYEQISLMHGLTSQLRLSTAPSSLIHQWIGHLQRTIHAVGCGVWLQDCGQEALWITSGKMKVDPSSLPMLLAQFDNHDWSRPLVQNLHQGTTLCPGIDNLCNLIITPLNCSNRKGGWIIAENAQSGCRFGTVEASLLVSVSSILATHLQNVALYRENDDLLRSFVESLVSTIDAKDPYTKGHSNRVAAIARMLAKQLGLSESQQQVIYLSGLVHDIGKIGIDDTILQKSGRLTEEEYQQIQLHPLIGEKILRGVRNLEAVVPGVRHHHEAYDGSGYPDGLAGPRIPRIARILAVADAYDAMMSDRPYREGLPSSQVSEILLQGSGRQWDPAVVNAFLAICNELAAIERTMRQ